MAGTSSDTSYVKIGGVKTSSHPEIEPEIDVVEASGDSNEVCSSERKECDEIMEHFKNNLGLVVKSLGLEGQIVLNVAVTSGEATKKPNPPAFECTNGGFSKAKVYSDWYNALMNGDCNALKSLLEANPCLVMQMGLQGKTVLHVAAQCGCLKLFHQVLDLFEDDESTYSRFVDEKSRTEISLPELLKAKWAQQEVQFQNIAWHTFPRNSFTFQHPTWLFRNYEVPNDFKKDHALLSLNHKFIEISQRETSKKAFEGLEESYHSYWEGRCNGLMSIEEKKFHYACTHINEIEAENYLKTIIDGLSELETSESTKALTEVFQLHNEEGQTPFHATNELTKLLEIVPKDNAYKACVDAKDVRGWTILHCSAATEGHEDLKTLLKDERTDVNARTSITEYDVVDMRRQRCREGEVGMTALHLAILHNDATSVKLLLASPHIDVNALHYRWIICGYERTSSPDDYEKLRERTYWTPLQLAAIMGHSNVVRALLRSPKIRDIYGDEKLQNNENGGIHFRNVSPILFACASGDPDTLRLFLDNRDFDPLVKSKEGATALHYASNAMIPMAEEENPFRCYRVGPLLYFSDFGHHYDAPCSIYEEEPEDKKLTPTSYLGRQACVTMLLQAGVDIWEKDNQDGLANPGPQAPKEALLWWQEQMARETMEAKKSLNDAANAISVVAALVATASFVGPLQPPLGYGGDSGEGGVQDTHLPIRVFMVSNILSFYFAVASIMFAVVPSLPMPQEGIIAEWQRTRRSVGVAIFFLLMSVLGVLISFGTASNLVVSEDYSWQHAGLSFYPTLVGGFICILGISLLFIRLLRLVFHRNAKIRSLYKIFVKI